MRPQAAAQLWADILSGRAELQPARLGTFLVLSHADLKRHVFHYWYA